MLIKRKIILCLGSSCFSRGNNELVDIIQKFIRQHNLSDKVSFSGDHCFGNCSQGPNLKIGSKLIEQVNSANIEQILKENLNELIAL